MTDPRLLTAGLGCCVGSTIPLLQGSRGDTEQGWSCHPGAHPPSGAVLVWSQARAGSFVACLRGPHAQQDMHSRKRLSRSLFIAWRGRGSHRIWPTYPRRWPLPAPRRTEQPARGQSHQPGPFLHVAALFRHRSPAGDPAWIPASDSATCCVRGRQTMGKESSFRAIRSSGEEWLDAPCRPAGALTVRRHERQVAQADQPALGRGGRLGFLGLCSACGGAAFRGQLPGSRP